MNAKEKTFTPMTIFYAIKSLRTGRYFNGNESKPSFVCTAATAEQYTEYAMAASVLSRIHIKGCFQVEKIYQKSH